MRSFFMVLILFAITASPFSAKADVEKSASASGAFMSHYVWRGQRLSDGFVIQPSVGVTYGGFGANLWVNWDENTNSLTTAGVTETDLTLNYTFIVEKFGFDAGYIYYAFSGGGDTQEVYLTVSYDTFLSPSATLYLDFDEGEGGFLVFAIGHSFEFAEKCAVNLAASAGINFDNSILGTNAAGNTFSNFYNGDLSASVTIPITDALSIEPMFAVSFSLSDDAEAAIKAIDATGKADDSFVYGGVNATLSF